MSYLLLLTFLAAGFAVGRVLLRLKGHGESPKGQMISREGHGEAQEGQMISGKGHGEAQNELKALPKPVAVAMNVCLFGIVTLLGFKIGSDGTLLAQAGVIGLKALILAVGAVAGSVALVALYLALRRERGR